MAPKNKTMLGREKRQKEAQKVIKNIIPKLLASNVRARKGVENAELIIDPGGAQAVSNKSQKAIKSSKKVNLQPGNNVEIGEAEDGTVAYDGNIDVYIRVVDTLEAARDLVKTSAVLSGKKTGKGSPNVAVLNMASPLRPGGGVLSGASSQEESLCARTTLLPSLRDEWYRLPEYGGIWSPDVCVFRMYLDQDLRRQDWFYVDVISAAMLRFPEVDQKDGKMFYAYEKDREAMWMKIRGALRILNMKRVERVVLGAWGCGAFGNPVGEVAKAWMKVLSHKQEERARGEGYLKEIVFAIKDKKLAAEFGLAAGYEIREQVDSTAIGTCGGLSAEHGESLPL